MSNRIAITGRVVVAIYRAKAQMAILYSLHSRCCSPRSSLWFEAQQAFLALTVHYF